jgi:hypothetical protein
MKICVSTTAALLAFVSVSYVEGLALFKREKNIGMPPLPEKGKPKAKGEIFRKCTFLFFLMFICSH